MKRRPRGSAKATIPEAVPPPPLPTLLPSARSLQALLTPVVANAFDQLRVSVALWIRDDWWYPIHVVPSVTSAEYEQGVAPRRFAYNHRCFAEVHRTRRTVVGEHAGFFDLFVPVVESGIVKGV